MSQSRESILEEALIGLYKAAIEDFGIDSNALLDKAVLQIHESCQGIEPALVEGVEEAAYALQEIVDAMGQ